MSKKFVLLNSLVIFEEKFSVLNIKQMNNFFSIEFKDNSQSEFYGVNSIISISKGTDPHDKDGGEHTVIKFASNKEILIVGECQSVKKDIEDFSKGVISDLVLKEYVIQFEFSVSK